MRRSQHQSFIFVSLSCGVLYVLTILHFLLVCLVYKIDTAAYLLEKALQVESSNPFPLVEAIYWLESAYVIEQLNATQLRSIRALHYASTVERGDSEHVIVRNVQKSVRKLIANTLSDVGDVEGSGAVHTPAALLKNTGKSFMVV